MEQAATLGLVAAMAADKLATRFDLYSGVKKMHLQCSSCCTFDVDRSTSKTPPTTPTISGPFEAPTTALKPPLLQLPNKAASTCEDNNTAPAPCS